jgi:hypothetical protein
VLLAVVERYFFERESVDSTGAVTFVAFDKVCSGKSTVVPWAWGKSEVRLVLRGIEPTCWPCKATIIKTTQT